MAQAPAPNAPPVVLQPNQFQQLMAAAAAGAAAAGRGKRLTTFSSTDPTEWTAWKETFRKTALLNNWNDEMSRNQLAAALEGQARRMVADIPTDAVGLTCQQLLTAYERRFLPEAQTRFAVITFENAKQEETESELEWHTRLRELFVRAYPNENIETSTILVNHFIRHLKNPRILDHCYMANPVTYNAALTEATNKAAANAMLSYMGGGQPHGSGGSFGLNALGQSLEGCWICGKDDHFKRTCPKRGQVETKQGTRGTGGRGRDGRRRKAEEQARRGKPKGGRGGRRDGGRGRPKARGHVSALEGEEPNEEEEKEVANKNF